MKKFILLFALLIVCFGIGTTQAFAIDTANNNFTMVDGTGGVVGGTNDVHFNWDETKKTAVAASGQVSNATLSSTCPFFGLTWNAHDLAIYGPGTYTVYDGCASGSPGCGTGNAVTFTVGAGEMGAHMLFNWGASANIDVVNIWTPNAVFGPSPLWTGTCGSNSATTVWNWMSKDWNGDGFNGAGMTDGPFMGFNANFNVMGMGSTIDLCADVVCPAVMVCNSPLVCDPSTGQCIPENPSCNDDNACTTDMCDSSSNQCVYTPISCDDSDPCTDDSCSAATGCAHIPNNSCPGVSSNNFSMIDGVGNLVGGTNDVNFDWDGSMKTSVAASGQVSNASLSSTCPFFGQTWNAHDLAVYGPGTYTVYTDCPAGSPGCGSGTPVTFTVAAGEIGGHTLFNWGGNNNIDVVNVWKPNAVFAPSAMYTGACGSNSASTVWGWMSKDVNGDGINGHPMVDGPFVGMNASFNLIGGINICDGIICEDLDLCTTDACDPATGNCVYTSISCDDSDPCTDDMCDAAVGCVNTPNNTCTGASGSNFTMVDQSNSLVGGTNDVNFTWDGTKKTAVAASGQVSNASLSSTCSFFGQTWNAHDVAIYGPGTYIVHTNCPAGSPGCGTGSPITFTVGAGEIGGHMLFDWGAAANIDVVNVWKADSVFAPSPLYTGACGSNSASTVWGWMSKDVNGDGINGHPMVDGPFVGMNASFNLMESADLCADSVCSDHNVCTIDTCDPANGSCMFTPVDCDDNDPGTIDTCHPKNGKCKHKKIKHCEQKHVQMHMKGNKKGNK